MSKLIFAVAIIAAMSVQVFSQDPVIAAADTTDNMHKINIKPAFGERNMGNADRIIRLGIAGALIGFGSYMVAAKDNNTGYIPIAISAIPLFTSAIARCPLYYPFGISTLKKKQSKDISLLIGKHDLIGIQFSLTL